ncbi:gliding motility-associated C-terminal domain-containing protein [Winogradskyella undariae]|uniref:GEVED domain-containing protein n=1 Tax=Winogradskyella undariae TaxID=1285465 RepID=UPI00156B273F|nr:GEVED domain-containing protein [Winogradskyella undariae]NRR91294.1 gliding motility-associated C-terminal domain-containing protein [Winogradskyella undariae]
MKKITLFLIMLGFFLTASAQYSFPTVVGPTNVVEGTPVTIELNDVANSSGVPASSSGSYNSFLVTADWSAGAGGPWSSEADITLTTSAGSVTIDPPTTNGSLGSDAVITFAGELPGAYAPTTDGTLDLILNQSYFISDANWSNIVVTLYESPTCIIPSAMSTSMLTTTSVDLAWNAGDTETLWNLEYTSETDFVPGNGEEEFATNITGTPEISLTGLTEFTTYYVYYQSDCGTTNGSSEWAGPFTFYTGYCDSTPTSNDGNGIGQIQLGSEVFTSGGDITYEDFTATTVDLAASITANMQITFLTGYTYNVNVWIDINNDLVFDNDTELFYQGESTFNNPTILDASFLMPDAPLGVYNMRIGTADSGQFTPNPCYSGLYGVTADMTINITEAPDCVPPSALTATGIGASNAELSWEQAGTVSQWNVEVVPNGTTPTGTPTATDISNPYTATGLSGLTTYDYYVQANCGSEFSAWAGPYTFTTLCDVFIPDYIQNFSNITPDCWDEADSGDATTGPSDFGNGSWLEDGFLNDGNTGAYAINLWLASKSDWLLTPQFDLTGGPFQVEFDFGIMDYASSTVAGTLGSDDIVQLLMSTDNGTTWISLLTYDNTSVVSANGEHPVVDLTAYSGQIVQFGILASEGTVDDSEDVQVFVDNFRVRGIPTCPEPVDLAATNLSLTSTELSWTEAAGATSWNIQYGEAGFQMGTGTFELGITSNPYVLSGLTADTSYEFYVQAICSPGDESSYNGPFEFYTGYCVSLPTSNTGDGVNNARLGVIDFPSSGDVNYENNTSTVVNIFRGITTDFEIEFGHTSTYNTSVWIDFNNDLIFDDTELVFDGESAGADFTDSSHLFDASFIVPLSAQVGEHRMRVVTTNFSTPTPCYTGTSGVTLDFIVNIEDLTCTLAEAEYETVIDCDNDQFFINVTINDLGSATSLEISNNFDTNTIQALNTGTYQVGPFGYGTVAKVFVENEQDSNCLISSSNYEITGCPPENDNPCNATIAFVNDDILCVQSTPGTLLAATPTEPSIADPSCGGDPDDDVWFQFVAQNESQLISFANIGGSNTTDLDHSVYEGTCDNLTEISCTSGFSEVSSAATDLTIGETYYIRVYSGGNSNEDTTFDLCITPYLAPQNLECDLAENYCSGSDESDILYTYNTINVTPGDGTIDCLFSTPNPTYSLLEIGTSGDILIEMVQNTAFDANDNPIGEELDVDFILWGPFAEDDDLCDLSAVVDCSYSAAAVEDVTLTGAQQGEIYLLLITNFAQDVGVIQVRQTNVGGAGAGSTIADITASIVSDDIYIDPTNDVSEIDEVPVCDYDSITIETDSPFADDFIWTKDGTTIDGENGNSLIVTESGVYQVQAFDTQCNSNALSQLVNINLYVKPDPIDPQTITVCDGPEANGIEEFDLDALTTSLGLTGFTVTYYTSIGDAYQTLNPVSSPYESAGETLTIRVEDTAAFNDGYLGCPELADVELIVNERPVINQPQDFIVCDDLDGAVDGLTDFNLTSIDSEVTSEDNMEVSYYTSLEDAEAGTNALSNTYTSGGETIYVRALNTVTGCYETTSFNIEINLVPLADIDAQYNNIVCPDATTPVTIGILPLNFDEADVTISWELEGTPIEGSGLTLDTVLESGEYTAIIEFNDSGCINPIDITVEEAESCVFPEGISPGVTPGQNDTFDLSSFGVIKLEIFNRYGTLVYSKDNYRNEWHGQTNDGDDLPVGTYFYTVIYEGGAKSKSAWVYINR